MGHNIFEFTHPCDHEEIRTNLRLNKGVCSVCLDSDQVGWNILSRFSLCSNRLFFLEDFWCGAKRDFVLRIKSALTHRGKSANLKSATWKVSERQFYIIPPFPSLKRRNHQMSVLSVVSVCFQVLHCQGRAKVCVAPSSVSCLVLTCQPLPLTHTLLSTHTFTSQHSMDMRFTYCDQR